MIRFEELTVRYPGATRTALADVTFDVPRGRITAVAGPNGSGKSTLVRALIGRVSASAGAITVDGVRATPSNRRALAQRIAVVTQRESTVFPLPVRDYIALGRAPHASLWSGRSAADRAAIDRAVALSGVGELLDRPTHELSGGEWQRARIARALAQGGDALVLDEPSTFLDVAHEMATFQLLDDLGGRGHAVLLVSHQLNLVARFAATIVLLKGGTVAAVGTPSDVMKGAILEQVYDWPVVVTHDPAVGAPALVPLRAPVRA